MSTTMTDLLARVERDDSLVTVADKAMALVRLVPSEQHGNALGAMVVLYLTLRQMTKKTGRFAPKPSVGLAADDTPATHGQKSSRREGHASPKIALATQSWNDLLETQIALPGMSHKTAIADMPSEQLRSLADSLYETHEQVHRLAEAVDLAGVETARDLEPKTLEAVMSEAA